MGRLARLVHSRLFSVAAGVALACLWGRFAWNHLRVSIVGLDPAYGLFCVAETIQAVLVLVRRAPRTVSVSLFDWLVAGAGTFGPFLLVPGGAALWAGGKWVLTFGVAVQVVAVLSLNRSFALVPANRQIKTRGLYRVIRHPMYASYLLTLGGYVLFNASIPNLAVTALAMALLVVRLVREEKHLLADPEYLAYTRRVPWRLLPFVY